MVWTDRIEKELLLVFEEMLPPGCPPRLNRALRYAVFPGGGRIRPQLCLSVASACGDENPRLADAAAAAIELLHCASLVHDDMPVFDNAEIRRGRPSVHKEFGEPLAVLAGDALIVTAFEHLARAAEPTPQVLPYLIRIIGKGVSACYGIIAGQAWESEPTVSLSTYHKTKTGSLFEAAASAGALAGGGQPSEWKDFGENLGEAYQVADDISDVLADPHLSGKPKGQDAANARPNAVFDVGLDAAFEKLSELLFRVEKTIPPCSKRDEVKDWVRKVISRFLPHSVQDRIDRTI